VGHIGEVEKAYRRLLKVQPDHPDALHLLGVISHQFGRNLDAVELINRAIEVNQRQPAYLSNLGEAHRALGGYSIGSTVSRALDCLRTTATSRCSATVSA